MEKGYFNKNSIFRRLAYKINFVSFLMICIWMMLPYFRVRAGVSMLIVFFVIWLATTDLRWLVSKWSLDLCFLIIFFITFIPYFLTGDLKYGSFGTNAILVNFPLFFMGIIINHYYMYYKKDYFLLGKIASVTIVLFIISSIQTYIGLTINPLASRILATGPGYYETEKIMFNRMGVGGFGYIYASCFMFLAIFYLLIRNNHRLQMPQKTFSVIVSSLLLITIFKASYAIAFMIIIIGTTLVLIVKNKRMLIVAMIIASLLLLLIPNTFIGDIFINSADLFNNDSMMHEKLTDLGMSFLMDSQSSQISTRPQLYATSFNTFLRQPLFGIYGPMGNPLDPIGAHSGWLDLLGFYGLFSGIPLFLIFYCNFKKHFRFYKKDKYYGYLVVIYFLFLVFGTINPVLYVYEVGFIIFMIVPIVPLISKDFGNKKAVLSLRGVENENPMDN